MSHVLEKRGKMWQAVFFTVILVTFLPFLISRHFSSFLCLFDLFGGASAKELKDMGFECRDLVDFFEVTDLVNATFSKVRLWQLWADHVQSKIVKGYQQDPKLLGTACFSFFSHQFPMISSWFSVVNETGRTWGLSEDSATLEVWSKLVSWHLISRRSIMAIVRWVCWDVEEVSFDKFHIVSQVQESLRSFMNSNSFSVRCESSNIKIDCLITKQNT